MKKIGFFIVAAVLCLVSLGSVYAEGYSNSDPYYTDDYVVDETEANRIVYEFITDQNLIVRSDSSGQVYVKLQIYTNDTMQKLGFTSLKVQRWNGTTWVTDEEATNQFSNSTDFFQYSHSFIGLSSGYQYRVKVTLRARRVPGEVQDMTITSDSIICH